MRRRFHITTFGCQMNEHDSEIMAGMLEEKGFVAEEDRDKADLLILNTCSVRENADKRFFGTLGQLKHRREEEDLIVCVCGCMMQQQHIIDTLKQKYPWVDIVMGTHNIHRLPALLDSVESQRRKIIEVLPEALEMVEELPASRRYACKALVNIMYGCNNFCTYCIVPYTRGRERSRPPESILKEIGRLAKEGAREVMLLGQNVNSYQGVDEAGRRVTFAKLVEQVAEVDGIERIRFMTSHPKDLSDELIHVFRSCPKLCKNIHLPVQSGSTEVLRRMNRRYTRERYLEVVHKLRDAVPGITISTDIIVGFPGETEEQFLETLDLVRQVRYDSAFTFLYSVRKGTPAADYEDQIPEDVKHHRFNRLVELVDSISAEKNHQYEGRIERILVEGPSKRTPSKLTGRTDGFKLVNFSGDKALIGSFMDVKIIKGKTFSLEGELIERQETE